MDKLKPEKEKRKKWNMIRCTRSRSDPKQQIFGDNIDERETYPFLLREPVLFGAHYKL